MQQYNFQDCHQEKINIPGYIQSFGYLIAFDYETWRVEYCSDNIHEIFNVPAKELVGCMLYDSYPYIYQQMYNARNSKEFRINEPKNHIFEPEIIEIYGKKLYYQLYTGNNLIYVEMELVLTHAPQQNILLNLGNEILLVESKEKVWDSLVKEIYKIIGYDRVMVYKFLDDGSGKVIAEQKNETLDSLLNVHYPETDIPQQARALYLKKRKRIIANVNSENIPILSTKNHPIDLTYSSCRAVSPIHIEYLKNSDVGSSFSTSIIINDLLFGLVACQNNLPKHIDLYDRQIAEVLTRIAANAYSAIQNKKQLQYSHHFFQKSLGLKDELLLKNNLHQIDNLTVRFTEFVQADGVVISNDSNYSKLGDLPDDDIIKKLISWSLSNLSSDIYFTENLSQVENLNFAFDSNFPGIMVMLLDKQNGSVAIWFKKEKLRHIRWAGVKELQKEIRNIHGEEKLVQIPRQSFDIVQETLGGYSTPWTEKDIAGITILQNLIIETSKEKNAQIAELNRILQEKNEELDTFSYTVSHDLRSPLTVMGLNAQQLLQKSTDETQKLKIKEIIHQVNDLTQMMNDILNLSRVNKSEIQLISINPESTIHRVIQESKTNYDIEHTQIVFGEFNAISADKTMAYQVFLNVIGNAIKYSSKTENPKVEIYSKKTDNQVVYYISDNGIGISEDSRKNMFQLFSRQPNAMEFKGSGVGLSIVKRLMQRMGGDVDFDSEIGKGTIFRLIFGA